MPHLLFDLDGTITNPQEGILNSIRHALKRLELPVLPDETLLKFIGPPLGDSFMKFCELDHTTAMQAIEYYREYFGDKGLLENHPYKGMATLLAGLKMQGNHLYVATSKPTFYARQILEHFNLIQYFEDVTGSNMDNTRTDKAEIIHHVLTTWKLPATECIMIGDRKHDVMGAIKNGVKSIGITYGFGSREELESAGAKVVLDTVEELKLHLG